MDGRKILERMFEAFNTGDMDGAVAMVHPEAVVHPAIEPLEPVEGNRGPFHGRVGLRAFFQQLDDTWESVTVELKELIDGREGRILAVETWRVRGSQGIEVDTEMVDVYEFRDDLLYRCDGFRDKAEAFEKFGP